MNHLIKIESLEGIDAAARAFLDEIADKRLVAFYGKMGAGKTTFTSALCRQMGVTDKVCSPTFTIVNEYETRGGEIVYHFDFYRIKNLAEAMDIGIGDYFYSGRLCIMEWPENIEALLPDESLKVYITAGDDGARTITWED